MAFKPLSSRLNDLPDVLVGPMLRLVQADQVSVFLVLKAKTKVTLEVFESETNGAGVNRRISGTRSTVQLGAKLHAVCVTAKGPPLLTPGTQYVYDVKLGTADGNDNAEAPAGRGLFTPGVIRGQTSDARDLLLYPQGPQLPSFVLPPAAVDDLRILHASCRKPHGKGEDALAIGDEIVATAIADDFGRPHQLFLGGDQIYADDVAISLLAMLQDAARPTALGFPVETLPTGGGKPGSDFHPDARAEVVTTVAGLTSDDADSHLLTFADFALMYAFAWSDALWPKPPAELPDFAAALEDEYAEWAAEATQGHQRAGRPAALGGAVEDRQADRAPRGLPQGAAAGPPAPGQRADADDLRRPRDHGRLEPEPRLDEAHPGSVAGQAPACHRADGARRARSCATASWRTRSSRPGATRPSSSAPAPPASPAGRSSPRSKGGPARPPAARSTR